MSAASFAGSFRAIIGTFLQTGTSFIVTGILMQLCFPIKTRENCVEWNEISWIFPLLRPRFREERRRRLSWNRLGLCGVSPIQLAFSYGNVSADFIPASLGIQLTIVQCRLSRTHFTGHGMKANFQETFLISFCQSARC